MSETVFKKVDYRLQHLIESIDMGQIGLPDIQRPFVWNNTKVRDLFDSMYRGYPVGYLLFWESGSTDDDKYIGTDAKQKTPGLLIVDGQQRLTSLYAVLKGVPVVRQNYRTEQIEIAFNPLQEKFEVADAAVRRDRAYIADISALWNGGGSLFQLFSDYVGQLAESREVSPDDRRRIENAFTRLYNLLQYPFTALELSRHVTEEQVAEVFVRVNSRGKTLSQADFVLTLMSVFWDEGRKELEDYCRLSRKPSDAEPSPYNHYIQPDPDQLLRVAVGVGFRRARLQYVYSILRGKDLETGEFSSERRDQQFDILKNAQKRAIDLTYWHDYFKALRRAGFLGGRLISSHNNLLYTYVLYLLGRTEYGVPEHELRRVIARWFFMTSLTGRYTGSPESAFESDLARFRDVSSPEGFVSVLERICESTLTSDFWTITLPNELATSSPRSPSLFAYYAALVLHDARALFSDQKIESLLDPSVHSKRKSVERHHLFPRAYLARLGFSRTVETNQIANYALVEWGDNSAIAASPPYEYEPVMRARVDPELYGRMTYWHALPDGWASMDYKLFLEKRRELMAGVIKDAYDRLARSEALEEEHAVDIYHLVDEGETDSTEFKSTLRMNLHTGKHDRRMELACLKTIAGFLNSNGGTLVIGVADDGTPVGIDADGFESEDKMNLHLVNLIRSRLGPQLMMYVHPRFSDYEMRRVMRVECTPAKAPVYLKDGNDERFYIRAGPSTVELKPSEIQQYIAARFP